jgi:hypothetical protein
VIACVYIVRANMAKEQVLVRTGEWSRRRALADPRLFVRQGKVKLNMTVIRENLKQLDEGVAATMFGFLCRSILERPIRIQESRPMFTGKKQTAFYEFTNSEVRSLVPSALKNHIAAGFCGHSFRPHSTFGGRMTVIDFNLVDVWLTTTADGQMDFEYTPAGAIMGKTEARLMFDSREAGVAQISRVHPVIWTEVSMPPRPDGSICSIITALRDDRDLYVIARRIYLLTEMHKANPVIYTSKKQKAAMTFEEKAADVYARGVAPDCPNGDNPLMGASQSTEHDEDKKEEALAKAQKEARKASAKVEAALLNSGYRQSDVNAIRRLGILGFGADNHLRRSLAAGEEIQRGPNATNGLSLVDLSEAYETKAGALFGLPRECWAESTKGNKLKTNAPSESSAVDISRTTTNGWCKILSATMATGYRLMFTAHLRSKETKEKKAPNGPSTSHTKASKVPDNDEDENGVRVIPTPPPPKKRKDKVEAGSRRPGVLERAMGKFSRPSQSLANYDSDVEEQARRERNKSNGEDANDEDEDQGDAEFEFTARFTFMCTLNFPLVQTLHEQGCVSWDVFKPILALVAGLDVDDLLDEPEDTPETKQTLRHSEAEKKLALKYAPDVKQPKKKVKASAASTPEDEEESVDGDHSPESSGCSHGSGRWLGVSWIKTSEASATVEPQVLLRCSHCQWQSSPMREVHAVQAKGRLRSSSASMEPKVAPVAAISTVVAPAADKPNSKRKRGR